MLWKIEKILLFILFALFPSQLALHFWPEWSLVFGVRVDYLSPTVYFTDLVILELMFLSRFRVTIPKWVIIFSVLNIFFSLSPFVSIYKWIRVYEYWWLFNYLVTRKQLFKQLLPGGLSIAVVWTAVLAIWQMVTQSSVGGLWYWLGERTFNLTTPGIARVVVANELWLRPYATLPHPNALAGFLLVAGLVLWHIGKRYMAAIALAVVVITFSKSAILVLLAIIVVGLAKRIKNNWLYLGLLLPIVLYSFLPTSPDTISQRLLLNSAALSTIKDFPLVGVGLGNSLLTVPKIRQPVHNALLLVVSELGILLGSIALIQMVKPIRKILNRKEWAAISIVVAVGAISLVDHYWITLHQNILLLVIALPIATPHDREI